MNRNPDLDENPQEGHVPCSVSNKGALAPQPTSTISVPAPPPQNVTATGNASAVSVLNPFGPRNEMSQGGIVFDLVGLCYSQFIQIPNQLEITDSSVPWTVIAQLPYNPLSEYCNKYIRNYASLHSRYNGDMLYQIEVIGNATYSGTIMIAWMPQKYNKAIADPEDIMKYSYKTMSVTLPSVEEFVLKDARQYEYYRTHSDNIDQRPHLVILVHTSVVSPLRDGITVRLRIGSRLMSLTDQAMGKGSAMMFCDPVPAPITPVPSASLWNGRSFLDVFPHFALGDYRLMLDGSATLSTDIRTLLQSDPHVRKETPGSLYIPVPGQSTTYDRAFYNISPQNRWILTIVNDFPLEHMRSTDFKEFYNANTNASNILSQLKRNAPLAANPVIRVLEINAPYSTGTLVAQITGTCEQGNFFGFLFTAEDLEKLYAICDKLDTEQGKLQWPFQATVGPTTQTIGIVGLPVTWRNVCITSLPVTSVIATDVAPTFRMDGVLQHKLEEVAKTFPEGSSLQFDLQDSESKQRVGTFRYVLGRRALVAQVAGSSRYALYPANFPNLVIANFGPVSDASSIPYTDVANWPSRTPSSVNTFNARNAAVVAEMALPETVASMDAAMSDLGSMFANGDSQLLAQAKTWNWGTGRPLYQLRESSAQTMPRFDNQATTQTGTSMRDATSQASIPPPQKMQFGQITSRAMSLGEIQSLVGPNNRYAYANGSAVSSGVNWAHDRDILDRAQSYQGNQADKDRQQAIAMQQAGFSQEQAMQNIKNAQALQYQDNDLTNQRNMQQAGFNQQTAMQQAQFGQDSRILNSQQEYGREMAGVGYQNTSALNYQNILGNLANTATGGALGVVTEGMRDISSYVNQKSNQNFQEKMNPIIFKQQQSLQAGQIAGTIANTATGGLFGLAGSLIKGAEDVYLNHSNQVFNQQMLTQQQNFAQQQQARNFNNAIYATGMSAQALKVA